ncbi:MAG: hypothetical protein JWN48_369 [Myxococcaceae bacterium]|nr:hypothetical protein [Myxococcaceae bacterium]
MRTATHRTLIRVIGLFGVFALLCLVFIAVVRPWFLHWGASAEEASTTLAGDELIDAKSQCTRAIDIDSPVEKVWPWLLQLGQDRGGFYSYELLENLIGTNMRNVDVLLPDLQRWKVGDKLWMYPADKLGGAGFAVLQRFDPDRDLVFGTRQYGTSLAHPVDGSWAFILRPLADHRTRLLIRSRSAGYASLAGQVAERLVVDPLHFMMERKMMEGIKTRAEGLPPSPLADLAEVSLFASCFAMLVSAVLHVVRWLRGWRSLLFILALALAFQLLTFVQPPWILGLLVVASLGAFFETVRYAPEPPRAEAR